MSIRDLGNVVKELGRGVYSVLSIVRDVDVNQVPNL